MTTPQRAFSDYQIKRNRFWLRWLHVCDYELRSGKLSAAKSRSIGTQAVTR